MHGTGIVSSFNQHLQRLHGKYIVIIVNYINNHVHHFNIIRMAKERRIDDDDDDDDDRWMDGSMGRWIVGQNG